MIYNFLTEKGRELLLESHDSGMELKVTRIKLGDGTLDMGTVNPETFTDVQSLTKVLPVIGALNEVDSILIQSNLDNINMTTGFYLKEVGLFVLDKNDNEILYAYKYIDTPQYLRPYNEGFVSTPLDIRITYGNGNVGIYNIGTPDIYVRRDQFESEIYKLKIELEQSIVPTPVGGILMLGNNTNPAEIYPDTVWEKVEGQYIRGTIGTESPLITGGSNSVSITRNNLPNIQIEIGEHEHGVGSINATGSLGKQNATHWTSYIKGSFYVNGPYSAPGAGDFDGYDASINFELARTLTGSTGRAGGFTEALGSGVPLTIEPSYIKFNIWIRLS